MAEGRSASRSSRPHSPQTPALGQPPFVRTADPTTRAEKRIVVLFLSGTLLNRLFRDTRAAYPSAWVKALDRAKAMKPDHLHRRRRTRIYQAGPASNEENQRLSSDARSRDRGSDATPRRRAGRRCRKAGQSGRIRLVDARLVARANRGPEGLRRAQRRAQVRSGQRAGDVPA